MHQQIIKSTGYAASHSNDRRKVTGAVGKYSPEQLSAGCICAWTAGFYYESSVEGKKLAEAVQSSLNEKLEIDRPREIKGNTSYYLLKRSPGTLVIVECGFLTNPEEARKLQTEVYQQRVAAAVADGIDTYLHVDNRKSYS